MSARQSPVLAICAIWLTALPAPAADTPKQVHIAWFGRTGGVSNHSGRNLAHVELYEAVGAAIESVEPRGEGPSFFAHRGRLAFRPDGLTVQDFRQFLAAGPFTREVQSDDWPVLSSPFEVLAEFPPDRNAPLLDLLSTRLAGLVPQRARLVRYENAEGAAIAALELPDVDLEAPLAPSPADWELRFAFRARVIPRGVPGRLFFNIGRPVNDGARRVPVVEAFRAAHPDSALVLAGGEDIEDFSFVVTGRPDLQRPNTWRAFERMGLDALVPGRAEAAFGLEALRDASRRHHVPLLMTNVGGETDRPMARTFDIGGVKILVVGLVDPELNDGERIRGFEARPFIEPASAVHRAVAEARAALGRRPAAVVVIGNLSANARAQLLAVSNEIDVLLADFDDHGVIPEQVETRLSTKVQRTFRARHRQPLSIVAAGRLRLGTVALTFAPEPDGGYTLIGARSEALPIAGDARPDPALGRAVQETRQRAYAPAQARLLPDLGDAIVTDPILRACFEADPLVRRLVEAQAATRTDGAGVPGRVTAGLWRQLVVNVLRERFDGELALIPQFPFPWALTGPISVLEAAANLNVPDEVVVVHVDAAKIRALAASPALRELVWSGFDPAGPKVLGRDVADRENYRVITTNIIRADPRFERLLDGPAIAHFAEPAGFESANDPWHPDAAGRRIKVRDAVLGALVSLGAGGEAPIVARLHPGGIEPPARWIIDLDDLSVEGRNDSIHGPTGAYSDVRETRVTTGAHQSVAARGDLYIRRQGRDIDWVNHAAGAFAKAYYDDAEDQETADEASVDTELQIRAWPLFGDDDGVPFTNIAYHTEFTPTEGNPRKKRLEGSVGLDWTGLGLWRSARLAFLLGQDFAEPDPSPEVGFLGAFELRHDLPRAISWYARGEGRYYLPDLDRDTDSELGTIVTARTGLEVPVFGGLKFGVFVDLFGYRGKVDATSDPGASLQSGVTLGYSRLWKPGREPLIDW